MTDERKEEAISNEILSNEVLSEKEPVAEQNLEMGAGMAVNMVADMAEAAHVLSDCEKWGPERKAYADGQSNVWRRFQMRKRLERCVACRQEIEEMRSFRAALQAADATPLPPGLRARLLAIPQMDGTSQPVSVPSDLYATRKWSFRSPSRLLFAGVAVPLLLIGLFCYSLFLRPPVLDSIAHSVAAPRLEANGVTASAAKSVAPALEASQRGEIGVSSAPSSSATATIARDQYSFKQSKGFTAQTGRSVASMAPAPSIQPTAKPETPAEPDAKSDMNPEGQSNTKPTVKSKRVSAASDGEIVVTAHDVKACLAYIQQETLKIDGIVVQSPFYGNQEYASKMIVKVPVGMLPAFRKRILMVEARSRTEAAQPSAGSLTGSSRSSNAMNLNTANSKAMNSKTSAKRRYPDDLVEVTIRVRMQE